MVRRILTCYGVCLCRRDCSLTCETACKSSRSRGRLRWVELWPNRGRGAYPCRGQHARRQLGAARRLHRHLRPRRSQASSKYVGTLLRAAARACAPARWRNGDASLYIYVMVCKCHSRAGAPRFAPLGGDDD